MNKNKVLILLDGTEFRKKILPTVEKFLRPEETEIVLLRVAEYAQQMVHYEYPLMAIPDIPEKSEITAQTREEMIETKVALEEAGYEVHREVRLGGIAREVELFINSTDVDLVAMATYGRSGLGKLIYGSVAEHLLRNISIPMLLLRPKD